MATELKLPQLGENVDSGIMSKLLVKVGDKVEKDQPVLELETDKATVEVPAFTGGVIKEILVKEGEKVQVGQVVLTMDEDGQAKAAQPETPQAEPPQAEPPQAEAPQDEREPEERIEERAEAQMGGGAGPQEAASDVSTPPEAAVEPAPAAKPRQGEALTAPPKAAPQPDAKRAPVPASPATRRMARELGVDISEVTGTGPGGRISSEDVKNYTRSLLSGAAGASSAGGAVTVQLPDFSRWGEVERQPMSGVRRKTAETMRNAWLSVPHVTQFDQADITELEQLRHRFGKRAEAAGGKLTVTAIALKVVAAALKVFPQFNASIDTASNEIVLKKYYNIGVAVDTDRGLLVPVIRDADRKNIISLSVELNQLAEKARTKKISLDEMQGGCFTITNLGGIGGTSFTPIVNAPEVAILGISRATQQPVFVDGQFVPRLMLPLSLSYDHRLIDGADGARFLRWVVEALQQPFLLTLEG